MTIHSIMKQVKLAFSKLQEDDLLFESDLDYQITVVKPVIIKNE